MTKRSTKPAKRGTKKHRVQRAPKKSRASKTAQNTVVDKTPGTANFDSAKILDIMNVNKSPLPDHASKTFRYSTFFSHSCAGGVGNDTATIFFSLASINDPDLNNVGTNKSCTYFNTIMGSSAGQYYTYRVKYIDVMCKVINNTETTFPMVCIGATMNGGTEFATTQYIHNIANRQGQISKVLEYNGDTNWSIIKFRVYPHKILGVKKRVYDDDLTYSYAYNIPSATTPWINITLGDSMQRPAEGDSMAIKGILQMEYHCVVRNPIRIATE